MKTKTESEIVHYKNWARAVLMLGASRIPYPVDVLYIPGLSMGMVASGGLFDIAAELLNKGMVNAISFDGSDGEGMGDKKFQGGAWPGKSWYILELKQRNVPEEKLFPTAPANHSRDETDKFLVLAQLLGWRTAGLLTVSYHIRCLMGLIKGMELQHYRMKVWWVGHQTNWWTPMLGSQNVRQTIPFDECLIDMDKTRIYIEKGDLCTFEELVGYLQGLT